MKTEKIVIWGKNEYEYEMAEGFVPSIRTYLHEENEEIRPCMLVVPGGGYCFVSPTEGEIVAKKFYEMGYNAFVLTYTINMLMNVPLKDQPMKDLSRAIRCIRRRAAEFHIDGSKLAICGFSAGSHLCASVCVHFSDVEDTNSDYQNYSNRPDAAILSYPVITSGVYAHRGSFIALLGNPEEEAKKQSSSVLKGCRTIEDELQYMSLETQVTPDTPPCFLWQTVTDEAVPVENSYFFAEALKKNGVPFAHHVFSYGHHGLSLADEDWAMRRYGEPYTLEQSDAVLDAISEGVIPMDDARKEEIFSNFSYSERYNERGEYFEVNDEVRIWPELAEAWLKNILQ